MLTIYKASAGSGKTYTLAYQYIKILLAYYDSREPDMDILGSIGNTEGQDITSGHPGVHISEAAKTKGDASDGDEDVPNGRWRLYGADGPRSRHRNILAVTFTHKATEEMKNRIIKELRQIVNTAEGEESERSDYAKKLLDLTGCTPSELKDTAQKALDDLLYDFHFFNVSTIDSFFQQVLRGFAREVAQNEDFALEIDNKVAVTMGVDSMLNSINTDPEEETKSLANFIEEWMRSEYKAGRIGNMFNRNADLYKKLVGFVASTMNEEFKEHSEEVIHYLKDDPQRFARFRKALNDRKDQIKEEASRLAKEAMNLLDSSDKIVQDNLNHYVKDNLCALAGRPFSEVPFKWEGNVWTREDPGYVRDALNNPIGIFKAAYKKKFSEPPQPLCDVIARTFETVIEGVRQLKWLKAVTALLSHFGVLVSALEFIMQYRQDNNLILLSDTNELLQKVIDDSDAPFIYEKLGNRLEYYLIDEFQDTSRLQWDNLRPLVQNSISMGNDNLIIGDEKQSIYRFRNADAELLHTRAQNDIGYGNYTVRGDNPGENTNYRSAPAVVRFNNALFSYLGEKIGTMYFKNVIQDIPKKNRNKRGHVRFDIIESPNKTYYGDVVLPRLLSDIRSLRQRGYSNGDIVVLVRTREQGTAVVSYLLQQNDPDIVVASDESLMLTMCPSVRVIISALRMFAQNREAQEGESNGPYDSNLEMRINEVEFINSGSDDISRAVLEVVQKKKDELKRLDDVINYRSSNLFTLTERIIQDILTEEMRRKDYSYIMAFQDYVTKFCSQFTSNVRKFLRWWDMNERSLTVSASPNVEAIRVMTIHKSKGLEFKCVLIPFTDIDVKDQEELWLPGDRLKNVASLKISKGDIPPLLRIKASSALGSEDCPFYEDYKEWRQNQKTDMLNVGYVAFTRAEHELIGYISARSVEKAASAFDSNPDVTDIGSLLVNAFYNVPKDEVGGKDAAADNGAQTRVSVGVDDGKSDSENFSSASENTTDANDELYYCKNREVPIPLTMPLKPYFTEVEFASLEDYIQGKDQLSLENEEVGNVGEGDDQVPEPIIIYRFEYGQPTVFPACEYTPEEKEALKRQDLERQAREIREDPRFRSPLETITIAEYTPTFPKNVEHYFSVEEEEDTFEEKDISSDIADSPSEDDGLPGEYGHQLWGEILHRAMSYIRDKVDAERAIARVSRQFQMDDASYDYLCRRVWETVELEHPRVKMWFDRRSYASVVTERPIYEPTTLATYRPDRIVWYKDGSADIIDYKFGSLYSNEYDFQMRKYIELIQDMGVPNVRGFIYFPTSKNIKEIHK